MTPDLSYEHLKLRLEAAEMEVAAGNLQLLMARGIIVDLLKPGDWADIQVREANAQEWLEKNRLSHEATMNAFGALLAGEGE